MSIPLLTRLSIGRIIPNEAIYMKKAATFMGAFDLQISWQGMSETKLPLNALWYKRKLKTHLYLIS